MINHDGPHIRALHASEKDGLRLEDRALYLLSNAADAGKLISYMNRFPGEKAAHKADLKLAVGDVLVQACMMCLDLGWIPDEIYALGRQHVKERFDDFADRKWEACQNCMNCCDVDCPDHGTSREKCKDWVPACQD